MKLTRLAIPFLLVPLLFVTVGPARAASGKAKVLDVYGVAQKRVGSWRAPLRRLNSGDLLTPGSYIKTGPNAAVLLQFTGRHVLRVGSRTTVALRQVGAGRAYSFKVFGGQVWSKVQSAARPARYEVATPSAVVGVSGTLFSVFYDQASTRTRVSTDEGVVRVRQGKYNARVAKGFVASLRQGRIEGLNKAKPSSDVAQVWRLLRGRESWMQSGGKLRLDRRAGRSITQQLAPVRSSSRVSSPHSMTPRAKVRSARPSRSTLRPSRSPARSAPRLRFRRVPRSGRKIRGADWDRKVAKSERPSGNARRNEQSRNEQSRDEQKRNKRKRDGQKSARRSIRKRDDSFMRGALPIFRGEGRGEGRGEERDDATRGRSSGKSKDGDDDRGDEREEPGEKRGRKKKD